jgi:hypothetical protein
MTASEDSSSPKKAPDQEAKPAEAPAAQDASGSSGFGGAGTAKPARVFKMSDEFLMFKFKVCARACVCNPIYGGQLSQLKPQPAAQGVLVSALGAAATQLGGNLVLTDARLPSFAPDAAAVL